MFVICDREGWEEGAGFQDKRVPFFLAASPCPSWEGRKWVEGTYIDARVPRSTVSWTFQAPRCRETERCLLWLRAPPSALHSLGDRTITRFAWSNLVMEMAIGMQGPGE